MKHKCKISIKKLIAFFLTGLVFFSCDKEDDPVVNNSDYTLVTTIIGADMASYATYVQQFDINTEATVIDNSNTSEIDAVYNGYPFTNGTSMYFNKPDAAKIEKWDVNSTGNWSKSAETDYTDLGYQCNPCFWKTDVAFTGGPGIFKIAIFNPSTMQRTGFIDMSTLSRLNEVTDFPDAGDAITVQLPSEMIIRNNYMYVALFYSKGQNWTPCLKTCEIAVIDLTKVDPNSTDNASAVVKRISDTRGSYTGAGNAGGGSSYMVMDENNDIYVLCHNMWAGERETTGLPACVLRIKSGETEFDQNYYFDVEAVANNNPVLGLEYAGNGKFFGVVQDPSAIDPNNEWSYYLDPIYQWFRFDLYNQTATIVNNTYTKGDATNIYMEDGYAYLPHITSTETYITKVIISSLDGTKLFTTNGNPYIFKLD